MNMRLAKVLFVAVVSVLLPWIQASVCAEQAIVAENVEAIVVEGNVRLEESTVLLQVESAVGKPLRPERVSLDVKAIYQTGYFEQVEAQLRNSDKGKLLVFIVQEKPAVREIVVEGNDEVSTDTILEKLNIEARRFLDRKKISVGVEEVKRYYQSEGYYETEIDIDIKDVEQNQVDIALTVDEGKEKVIRQVLFEGNANFDQDDLRDVVETSRYKWWSSWATGSGVVKQELLDDDVRRVTHFYLTKGFVDAKVAAPKIEDVEDGLEVVFKVEEGEKFEFGKISASGTLLDDNEKATLKGVKAKSGNVFNVDELREDTFTVSEKFTDIGYAFANVDPQTNINREAQKVDVVFLVDKGRLIRINRIGISGNEKTQDNVVRRSLRIQETELFSSSKIKRSQELLQRLGYFEEVTITPEPSISDDEVDLVVAVREGQTGTFTAGAGISSGDGFIVNGRIAENNIFGTGNSLALEANTGSEQENYVLSFNNPRLDDSNWSLGADLLSVSREFDDFDKSQAGGSITFGYPLWFLGPEYFDDVRLFLGYELMKIDISDVDKDASSLVKEQAGKSTSSSAIPRVVRNTIDNPLDPTKGTRQTARFEVAGLGGDEDFWLTQLTNTIYYPLWKSPVGLFVFSQRSRFGWGETFDGEDFPLFRRFFPGGINSVRGYDARELGPKDEEGNEFGGNKELVGNFEIIFPIVDSVGLKGVVFYDIGNAFDDDQSMDLHDLRSAVGWGIRWRSPIAPIRIEIGYPLDREDGDDAVVTNFSFGSPL